MAAKPGVRRRTRLTPYLLILPTLLFLAAFFAYPMIQGLILAVYDDEATLPILDAPDLSGDKVGGFPQGTQLQVLGQQGNRFDDAEAAEAGDLLTEEWFRITGPGADGSPVDGWSPETRVRVRDEAADGTPLGGTIRTKLAEGADPLTDLFETPSESAAVVGKVEARETVSIVEVATLELWFEVKAQPDAIAEGATDAQGWVPSRFIQVRDDGETARVDRGTDGQFTSRFIEKMFDDRKFGPAWRTTLILMALILPLQFVLATLMALVIHARLKATSWFLYLFSLPMGMSDLAVGILFFSMFTSSGMINSVLEGIGFIDDPKIFLSAETRWWIIAAIVLAELWRATSIVMVIIVSGLQAIPDETLEAAELFGASYWQRVRHIMLPLLRPSIQVALILRTILAFQVFAVVIALGGGEVVTVLANETYRQYFGLRNTNVASAYAIFILLLSLTSAFFYLRALRSQQELTA